MNGNPDSDGPLSDPPINRPNCPGQVTTAYRLWFAAIALLVLGCVFALPPEQDLDQLLATSSLGQRVFLFDPGFALGTVGSVRALIQVSAFISAAIWAVIVIKMRTGAGWARLTLAALGVVHILAMLTQLIEGLHSELPRTFLVLLLALSITEFAAISVMFHPAAAPYFRSDQRSQ